MHTFPFTSILNATPLPFPFPTSYLPLCPAKLEVGEELQPCFCLTPAMLHREFDSAGDKGRQVPPSCLVPPDVPTILGEGLRRNPSTAAAFPSNGWEWLWSSPQSGSAKDSGNSKQRSGECEGQKQAAEQGEGRGCQESKEEDKGGEILTRFRHFKIPQMLLPWCGLPILVGWGLKVWGGGGKECGGVASSVTRVRQQGQLPRVPTW